MEKTNNHPGNVILIGGNHHNGLNLARSFGLCGIKPYGIIISDKKHNLFSSKSRFWKKTYTVTTDADAIELLLSVFAEKSGENEKFAVIPWSDGAAREIDLNYDRLSPYFILPSLSGKSGMIDSLMDKSRQVELAKKYGFLIADTFIINLPDSVIPPSLTFPCFLKPVASFEGDKKDICKCENESELSHALSELTKKGYRRILAQKFIDFDTEFTVSGSVGSDTAYFITEKVRTWAGSGSFVRCSDDKCVMNAAEKIIRGIRDEGFCGLFDIDLFRCGNDIYLNEINWRSSGLDYVCMAADVHFAPIWYFSANGSDTSPMKHFCSDTRITAMDDATDIRNVFFGNLSMIKWLGDFFRAGSYAVFRLSDMKPAFSQYAHLLKELIKRGGNDE